MRIIAVHDDHNASACLLGNGRIEFAIQEERISRIKNHSTFPSLSIKQILEYCKLSPDDIDYFVFSSHHIPKNKDREELKKDYHKSNSINTLLKRMIKKTPLFLFYFSNRKKERLQKAVDLGFSEEKIVFQDHHLSHAAAAYFGCPWWRNEPVLVLTNDAGGGNLCATVSIGNRGKLKRICEVPVSDSLGYIYSMITFILGMIPEEHEYKLMGMAPYSSKEKHEKLCHKFEKLIEFPKTEQGMRWKRSMGAHIHNIATVSSVDSSSWIDLTRSGEAFRSLSRMS